MKEILLTKVTHDELEVLQIELEHYAQVQRIGFASWNIEDFLNAIATADIAHRLWLVFRKRLESDSTHFRFSYKASDAVILFKCCNWERNGRNDYQRHVCRKYQDIIDNQFKSIIPKQQ